MVSDNVDSRLSLSFGYDSMMDGVMWKQFQQHC